MLFRFGLLLVGVIISFPIAARAHEDPSGCFESLVALGISAFRSDGVTPLLGTITDCEQIFYVTRLQKGDDLDSLCAFSGGSLTLTTPDGVVHTVSVDVPCIGGNVGLDGCFDALNSFD